MIAIQILALIFTMLGALLSIIASFSAQPLIPKHQYRLRDLRMMVVYSNVRLKELVTWFLDELEQDKNPRVMTITKAPLWARLKNLEEALEFSNGKLDENEKQNIFDESPLKAKIRLFYLLGFISIFISMILQSVVLLQE